jgi:hypothetical protein
MKCESDKTPEAKRPVTALAKQSEKTPMVSLKAICAEIKLDPRLAREKLRIAALEAKKFPELAKARKPRSAWEWPKGSERKTHRKKRCKIFKRSIFL